MSIRFGQFLFKCPPILFFLCLVSSTVFSQPSPADSIFAGFGNIRLGDPQSQYSTDLVLINGVDTTNPAHAPYYFGYNGIRPAATTPEQINFKSFLLGFNRQHTLVSIQFIQLYTKTPKPAGFPLYSQYKKDLKKLLDYYTAKLGYPPQKIVRYKKGSYSHINYVWESSSAKLTVDTQPDTKRESSSISIYLDAKP